MVEDLIINLYPFIFCDAYNNFIYKALYIQNILRHVKYYISKTSIHKMYTINK